MTLITDALDRIARQVSITPPASWVTATADEHVEIRDDFLIETVDNILDRIDVPSPIGKQTTITGDGSASYTLPSDFRRLQRDPMAVYETTSTRRACIPISDDGIWTHLNQIGSAGGDRYFKVEGYEGNWTISFYRSLATGDSATVSYISTLWMADSSGGTAGSAFTAAGDVLLLPRRLIEAGTVARWRDRRGLNAADKWAEFEAEIVRLSNDRRSRRIVNMGGRTSPRQPWDIPVPDYIPDS